MLDIEWAVLSGMAADVCFCFPDNIVALFSENGQSDLPRIEYRVKHLARLCINTLHFHR